MRNKITHVEEIVHVHPNKKSRQIKVLHSLNACISLATLHAKVLEFYHFTLRNEFKMFWENLKSNIMRSLVQYSYILCSEYVLLTTLSY